MKICRVCRKTDLLCQSCLRKFGEGSITQLDIDVARALNAVDKEADYVKIVDGEKAVIVVKPEMAMRVIGKGGKGVKKIEEMLKRKIKVLEKTEDRKKMAEDMLRIPVIGVNVLYSNGEKIRIRVGKTYRGMISRDAVSSLSKLYGKDVNILYE